MSASRSRPPAGKPDAGGEPERLQKVLARAGVASRRKVEEMIREGRITVNGAPATLGQRVVLAADAVKVDGRRVFERAGERRYLLLHKPAGCVSTRQDPEGRPTVVELLPPRLRRGLVPVGRLDYETEGLLILTDDGDFAQRVAHPRHGCLKTYEVKVKGRPGDSEIDRLRWGVVLDGKLATAVSIEPRSAPSGPRGSVSNSWWTVRLGEGRTRQIREMFFRIGHPVSRLRRVAIGPLADPHLPRGAWRELTEREVASLRRPTPAKSRPAPARPSSRRPAKTRPVRERPAKEGWAKAGPAKARATRERPAKAARAKARPARERPAKAGPARPARGRPAEARRKPRPPRSGGGGKGHGGGPRRGGGRG